MAVQGKMENNPRNPIDFATLRDKHPTRLIIRRGDRNGCAQTDLESDERDVLLSNLESFANDASQDPSGDASSNAIAILREIKYRGGRNELEKVCKLYDRFQSDKIRVDAIDTIAALGGRTAVRFLHDQFEEYRATNPDLARSCDYALNHLIADESEATPIELIKLLTRKRNFVTSTANLLQVSNPVGITRVQNSESPIDSRKMQSLMATMTSATRPDEN